MVTASTALTIPIASRLWTHETPSVEEDGRLLLQRPGSFPAISAKPHQALPLAQVIVAGIIETSGQTSFSRPTRLELIMREDKDGNIARGLVLFDERRRLIVHIVNATVGNGATEAYLSLQTMSLLGIPRKVFTEIQNDTWHKHRYAIVVERSDDLETSLDSEWKWWRVE